MSQHDMTLDNGSGAAFRGDANNALQALASNNAGAAAPSPSFSNQWWPDGTDQVLRRRNSGNSAWIIRDTLDAAFHEFPTTATTVDLRDFGKTIHGSTNAGAWTLSLPAVASATNGFKFWVRNLGTSRKAITIDPSGAELINGAATLELLDQQAALVQCDGTAWRAIVTQMPAFTPLPRAALAGLQLSNNATDGDHDIDVAVGQCRSAANDFNYTLTAVRTKLMDAAFSEGNGVGGLGTSVTLPTSGTLHVFAIFKTADGTPDIYGDTSVAGSNVPAGWSLVRRLGSVVTDASANIIAFTQDGDRFALKVPRGDVNALNPGAAAVLRTLSVPSGLQVWAGVSVTIVNGTSAALHCLVTGPDETDTAPSAALHSVIAAPAGIYANTVRGDLRTNTSAQIRTRFDVSGASDQIVISTHGWTDRRGRDA